ncbi:hypothetical protein NGB36_24165 [Streptomyces sp. RB6PN25]|uniref:Uncharacterized protein n=1 Tax=Streptomyces humicola TaxID=2953240 RepID=A0ABT1Q0Z9_9ACTN|nr:hypothetical protein [Streptomyces humicola]MCQ4083609.1 hypothetical protein [Streptomyces humicola]
MAESDFSLSGVQIRRWLRSLTRAGEVQVGEGRLVLRTSRGQEIDSAPLATAHASAPRWYPAKGRTRVVLDGRHYLLRLGEAESDAARRFLDALGSARGHAGPPGRGRTRG